jgi:WD40 repeat protein
MYVIDPVRTSGHTAPVTGVSWNPLERDIVATSSLDGSARIWNLNGKTQFQKLVCDKVYRGKNSRGQKVGVTSVAFHPSGRELAFGTADGSIQIWNATKVSARPERATYDTHGEGRPVHSLVFSVDGSRIASRSMDDDTVKLWDAKRMSRSSIPIVSCNGLPSVHENSNCSFSHDGRLLCAGSSEVEEASKGIRREFGYLKFYALPTSKAPVGEESSVSPVLALQVSSEAGAVQVVWHSKLNQVLVGCSDGR